ncbi:MAG: hypothetical protein HND47_14085 [Chloroflexi bacterium]|nr:hypothetical protein [Chloroflexota bacterium]
MPLTLKKREGSSSFPWAFICIFVFILFSARISYIHSVDLWKIRFDVGRVMDFVHANYWFQLLFSLAGVAIFSIACLSLGAFIANLGFPGLFTRNQPDRLSKLANIATQFLIGHGIYSTVFIILAGTYKLTAPIVLISLALGLLSGSKHLKGALKDIASKFSFGNNRDKTFLIFSLILLATALLLSSARISYDSSAIYFSNAKITAHNEEIRYFTEDTFVASAFQSTIQFSAIILVFGDQAARMFSWVCGLIIIVFGLAIGDRFGISRTAKIILLILIVTSTAFADLLGDGKVDLLSTAPAIAAMYWLALWSKERDNNPPILVLTGCLAGLSISARPFNAFLLGIFVVLYLSQRSFAAHGIKFSSLTSILTSLFWIGLGVATAGAFHLYANFLIQGSPFAFIESVAGINPESGPWDNDPGIMMALRLMYPLVVTFRNTPQSLGNISPLVMAFLPAIFIRSVRRNVSISQELKSLTAVAIVTIILWISIFFTVVEIRYVLFLWILIFLPVSALIEAVINSANHVFRNLATAVIALLLLLITARVLILATGTYSPLDSRGNPQCSNFILCDYFSEINRTAPEGARVLTLSSFRYYLRTDLFACSTSNKEYSVLKDLSQQSPDLFWEEVYRRGYSYIAYENDYTTRHLQFGLIPGPGNIPAWLELERIDQYNSDLVAAYKIHVIQPPLESNYECKLNDRGIWETAIKP